MPELTLPFDPVTLPEASQPEKAEIGIERLVDRYKNDNGQSPFIETLIADSGGRRLLDSIFGNSGFLGQCILQGPAFLQELLAKGPDAAFQEVLLSLEPYRTADEGQDQIMSVLRVARRRVALLTAIADITAMWPLHRVTGSLSKFADTATSVATAHLLRGAASQGALTIRNPDDPNLESGYFVLGMGKLGASP